MSIKLFVTSDEIRYSYYDCHCLMVVNETNYICPKCNNTGRAKDGTPVHTFELSDNKADQYFSEWGLILKGKGVLFPNPDLINRVNKHAHFNPDDDLRFYSKKFSQLLNYAYDTHQKVMYQ